MIKRLVCLANSRKLQGRCIAGRELLAGKPSQWIRPVSDREHEEVSERERRYVNGSDPRVLDIIDVPFIGPRAKPHQPENWLLDPGARWSKAGEFRRHNLHLLADTPGLLWVNGYHTRYDQNCYVPVDEVDESVGSLKLIRVDRMRLHVYSSSMGTRKVQAEFSFGDVNYRLRVTDPLIEDWCFARADRTYTVGSHYLTISLGEPWRDSCYKLVAAIIGALP